MRINLIRKLLGGLVRNPMIVAILTGLSWSALDVPIPLPAWEFVTLLGAAALLGAAITPLNMAEYEFIYPENNKAMGISMNTNIGSTMADS